MIRLPISTGKERLSINYPVLYYGTMDRSRQDWVSEKGDGIGWDGTSTDCYQGKKKNLYIPVVTVNEGIQ
jgi:hypothetical protein